MTTETRLAARLRSALLDVATVNGSGSHLVIAAEDLDAAIAKGLIVHSVFDAAVSPSPDASALREALKEAEDFLVATFGPIDGDTSDHRRWSDEDACDVARKIKAALSQGEA